MPATNSTHASVEVLSRALSAPARSAASSSGSRVLSVFDPTSNTRYCMRLTHSHKMRES